LFNAVTLEANSLSIDEKKVEGRMKGKYVQPLMRTEDAFV